MSSMDKVFVDTMVMADYFMANPSRLREFHTNKAKGTPTLDYTLEWFWFAEQSGIPIYVSNLVFWEVCSVLRRNHIEHNRLERAISQIKKFFKVEEELNMMNLALGLIFGAITGCDIKDGYHYVFALHKKVRVFVSRDKKFRRAIQKFYDQITHEEADKHYIQQMKSLYSKFPPCDNALKEQVEAGIEALCNPSSRIEIVPPENVPEISPH